MSDSSKAVFLSYASQDAEAARRICEALRAGGIEVWFDQSELVGGDAWDQKIRGQIGTCALFVPVISANTQARGEGYFRLEWKLAVDRSHLMAHDQPFLLPIVIDATKDSEARVPPEFRAVQWTRLPGGETNPAFGARVKKLIDVEGRETSPRRPLSEVENVSGGLGGTAPPTKTSRAWLLPAGVAVALTVAGVFFFAHRSPTGAEAAVTAVATPPTIVAGSRPDVAALLERVRALNARTDVVRAELDAAVGLLEQASKLDPSDAEVWAAWALIDCRYMAEWLDPSRARLDLAQRHATQAIGLAPKSAAARLSQATAMTYLSNEESTTLAAAKILEPLVEEPGDRADALIRLAILKFQLGQPEVALAYLDRAAASRGRGGQVHYQRATHFLFSGEPQRSQEEIERALAAESAARFKLWKSYLLMIWQGDVEESRRVLREVPPAMLAEDFAGSARYFVSLWARDYDGAVEAMRAVPRDYLESSALSGPAGYYKGYALSRAGKLAAAETEWRAALDVVERRLGGQPNDRVLLSFKVLLLKSLGETSAAEKLWRTLRELYGDSKGTWEDYFLRMELLPEEEAIDHLAKNATPGHVMALAGSLRHDPFVDRLRANPRFVALMARVEADPRLSPNAKPASASGAAALDPKSVAVLAFVNMSADKENEYFSDGIADELLTTLQKIPGLKVSAHTSAWSFKGKNATSQEIGEKLHVANIVEGSVQKSGNRVKITARLSRAATNEEVWSESFGPLELTDVFATQSEIAQRVVAQLRGKLMGETAAAAKAEIQAQVRSGEKGGTKNVEAHEFYLRGKFFANQGSMHQAEALFQQAVELDPQFAQAWAAWCSAASNRADNAETRAETDEAHSTARRTADRALAVEPYLVATQVARYDVQRANFDWKGAAESLHLAEKLAPGDAEVLSRATRTAHYCGQLETAIELGRQAVALDPVNATRRFDLGLALRSARRFVEAEAEFRQQAELVRVPSHHLLSVNFALQGRFDEAAAEARLSSKEWTRYALAIAQWGQKKPVESDATLVRLIEKSAEVSAYQIAQVYAFRQEADRTFEWLERAFRQRDPGLTELRLDLLFERLHADQRWPAFLKKIGLSDEQLK